MRLKNSEPTYVSFSSGYTDRMFKLAGQSQTAKRKPNMCISQNSMRSSRPIHMPTKRRQSHRMCRHVLGKVSITNFLLTNCTKTNIWKWKLLFRYSGSSPPLLSAVCGCGFVTNCYNFCPKKLENWCCPKRFYSLAHRIHGRSTAGVRFHF